MAQPGNSRIRIIVEIDNVTTDESGVRDLDNWIGCIGRDLEEDLKGGEILSFIRWEKVDEE